MIINEMTKKVYVATVDRGPGDVLTPLFYRIRIDGVSGNRANPDPVEEMGVRPENISRALNSCT